VQIADGAYYARAEGGRDAPVRDATATAMGLLSRSFLGWKPEREAMRQGIAYLNEIGPQTADVQFTFVGTVLLQQRDDGEDWERWMIRMRKSVIGAQVHEGVERGSWFDADEVQAARGGRLYQTALSAMSLAVYYRHLPLYERDPQHDGDRTLRPK